MTPHAACGFALARRHASAKPQAAKTIPEVSAANPGDFFRLLHIREEKRTTMSRTYAILAILICFGSVAAQELPPRFAPLLKNERFQLLRVMGTPEMPPSFLKVSAFSADGKRAVYAEDLSSGGDDKVTLRVRINVWDNGATWPREFELQGKNVTALSLSADGKRAVLAGLVPAPKAKAKPGDKDDAPKFTAYLSLFDLDAGKESHSVTTKEEFIPSVALASDGVTALAVGRNQVTRWDLKAGKEIGAYKDKERRLPTTVVFLPGDKSFLAGYQTSMITDNVTAAGVLRWDIDQPKKPIASYGNSDVWQHIAVSRDGKRFATADFNPVLLPGNTVNVGPGVTLWQIDAAKKPIGTQRLKITTADEVVTSLGLAADAKTVLAVFAKPNPTAEDYFCARIFAWDGAANKTLWSHKAEYRGTTPMLVKGDKLLVGGGPNPLVTWSITDGKRLGTVTGHDCPVGSLVVLASGDAISAGLDGMLITWRDGKIVQRTPAHNGAVTALAGSRDRKLLASAGADLVIQLDKGKGLTFGKGHTATITSLAFANSGTWLASASADRGVKTWDLKSQKEVGTLTGHSDSVNVVALSPDECWIASGSDDTTIRVWPIKNGKLDADRDTIVLEGHKKAVTCLAFAPDGKTLLSAGQDNALKVWDWAKEKSIRTIAGHKNWITSIHLLDDGTALTTSDDLTVCLWDVGTGKEIGRIDFGAVGDCPRCLARSGPDRILVGTSNWLIYEFQLVKTKPGGGSSK